MSRRQIGSVILNAGQFSFDYGRYYPTRKRKAIWAAATVQRCRSCLSPIEPGQPFTVWQFVEKVNRAEEWGEDVIQSVTLEEQRSVCAECVPLPLGALPVLPPPSRDYVVLPLRV